MPRAAADVVAIKSLEDLQVFQEALAAGRAVSAILRRPEFERDPQLRGQLATASASISAQIAEGYGQLTDRHFAHYLAVGRGGCNEMHAHLTTAYGRQQLSEREWRDLTERYDRLGKRLTRLIQHLHRENRKERG
jgi:four helix bundle protein